MFTIRDVITEALARSSLVSRRQPAPGNMVESAYRLLLGIASDYSKHNLLQFLRREVDLTDTVIQEDQYILGNGYVEGVDFWFVESGVAPSSPATDVPSRSRAWNKDREVWQIVGTAAEGNLEWQRTVYPDQKTAMAHLNGAVERIVPGGLQPIMRIGEIDNDLPNDWVQVHADNVESIKEVYWDCSRSDYANTAVPVQFVSYEDFNNGAYGDYVYTSHEISDTKIELRFKPRFIAMARGGRLIAVYNVKYEFDLDSVMRIPDIYKELFTAALTYALACEFPRLSPEHTERLKKNKEDIENSVKAPTRANKFVTREPTTAINLCDPAQLLAGSFLFPR